MLKLVSTGIWSLQETMSYENARHRAWMTINYSLKILNAKVNYTESAQGLFSNAYIWQELDDQICCGQLIA